MAPARALRCAAIAGKFGILGAEILEDGFAESFVRVEAERLESRARVIGETQIGVGGPDDRGHVFDHHGEASALLVARFLDALEIVEHAVDGGAEAGDFVVAGERNPRGEIAAGADAGDVVAEIGHAREHHALDQVEDDRAEGEASRHQQQQELDRAGLALLIDGSRQKNSQDGDRLSIDVGETLVGCERVAGIGPNEDGVFRGFCAGSGGEVGSGGRRVGAVDFERYVSHRVKARDFIGVEGAAHDQDAGGWACRAAGEDGA